MPARPSTASPASRRAEAALAEVALGGTAVGTGVNTHPESSARTCARYLRDDRRQHPRNRQPLPGPGRPGRHRGGQRPAQDRRRQPAQNRQRHPLSRLRPPRRPRRNQRSRSPARQQHHARQGQPRHLRVRHPGVRPRGRQRRGGSPGRRRRLLRAEHHDAPGRLQPVAIGVAAGGLGAQLRPASAWSASPPPTPARPWWKRA